MPAAVNNSIQNQIKIYSSISTVARCLYKIISIKELEDISHANSIRIGETS
jgi:hypothetical protein